MTFSKSALAGCLLLMVALAVAWPGQADAQQVEALFEFQLPPSNPACDPQPGDKTRAWLLPNSTPGSSQEIADVPLVFDNGLVLFRRPDGALRDKTVDHRSGQVGSLDIKRESGSAVLVLDPVIPACPVVRSDGALIDSKLATTESRERASKFVQAALQLISAGDDGNRANYASAIASAETATRARSDLLGASHPLTLLAERELNHALVRGGRFRDALEAAEAMRSRSATLAAVRASVLVEHAYVQALKWTGNSGKALPIAQQLVVRAAEHLGGEDQSTIVVRSQLGGIYRDARRFDEAINVFAQNDTILRTREGPSNRNTLVNLLSLAGSLLDAGRPEEAATKLEAVLSLSRERFGPDDELSQLALSNLISTFSKLNENERALKLAEELLEIRTRVMGDRHPRTLFSLRAVAYHKWATGRHQEAIAANRKLVDSYSEVWGRDHPETLWTIHNSVVYFQNTGRHAEAMEMATRVVASVERQHEWNALAPETRQSNFSYYANTFKIKAQLHAQLDQPEAAFAAIELTKARTLLDATTTRLARSAAIPDPAERAKVEALEARLEALNADFARIRGDVAKSAGIDLERNRVAGELSVLNDRLANQYPRYGQLRGLRAVSSEQLRASLPPRTLFLNYSLEGVHVLVAAVSHEKGLSTHYLGKSSALLVNLQSLATRMSEPNPDARPLWKDKYGWYHLERPAGDVKVDAARYGDLAEHISVTLLRPFSELIRSHDHVVISTDSALALIPMEALPFDGAPLLRRVNVSYAPSAAVFWLSQGRATSLRQGEKRIGLLAMGGVEYETSKSPSNETAAPAATTDRLNIEDLGRRAASRNRPMSPLPGSRREVEQAARHMKAHGTRTVLGAQANKSLLQSLNKSGELQRFRTILISAHGVLDAENPSLSAIVLAPDLAGDRYVTAADWMTYSLASDLIVASACETALGGQVNGEGITGLPFAFQAAGSARSLLTLWRVDDVATARFIDAYFARLARGEPPARALRAVKLQFMADSRLASPFFWAPFVLYGAADSQ